MLSVAIIGVAILMAIFVLYVWIGQDQDRIEVPTEVIVVPEWPLYGPWYYGGVGRGGYRGSYRVGHIDGHVSRGGGRWVGHAGRGGGRRSGDRI